MYLFKINGVNDNITINSAEDKIINLMVGLRIISFLSKLNSIYDPRLMFGPNLRLAEILTAVLSGTVDGYLWLMMICHLNVSISTTVHVLLIYQKLNASPCGIQCSLSKNTYVYNYL